MMKYFVEKISFDIEPEDIDLDEKDFVLRSDYLAACEQEIKRIEESLPSALLVEAEDESAIADAISDKTGWLVNGYSYSRPLNAESHVRALFRAYGADVKSADEKIAVIAREIERDIEEHPELGKLFIHQEEARKYIIIQTAFLSGIVSEPKDSLKWKKKLYQNVYQNGTRIKLLRMANDPRPVPSGTEGTVIGTDDAGSIRVRWDNGSRLNLIPEIDFFEIIEKPSPKAVWLSTEQFNALSKLTSQTKTDSWFGIIQKELPGGEREDFVEDMENDEIIPWHVALDTLGDAIDVIEELNLTSQEAYSMVELFERFGLDAPSVIRRKAG